MYDSHSPSDEGARERSPFEHFAASAAFVLVAFALGACARPADPAFDASVSGAEARRARSAPTTPETRGVDVLATAAFEEGVPGRTFPVEVTVAGGDHGELLFEFNETHSPGSGAMWRASELSAAVQAMLATSVPPEGLEITYSVEGDLDGPSAGALLTIGLMAAMQGHALRPDVTMTGTINPDGSIGAVSKIPEKVVGAGNEGMKLVLIPVGTRRGLDGQGPDVVEVGRRVGVEVREVADIYEAYEAMTGVAFVGAGEADDVPTYGGAFARRFDEKSAEWRARFERNEVALIEIDPKLLARFGSFAAMERAQAELKAANLLRAAGHHSAAYNTTVTATRTIAAARLVPEALERLDESGAASVEAWLERGGHVEQDLIATLTRIQQVEPRTFNDLTALAIIYATLLEGFSLERSAGRLFDRAREPGRSEAEVEALLAEAVRREVEAAAFSLFAIDYLDFRAALGDGGRAVEVDLDRVADLLLQAADANLMLFESITLATLAQASGLPLEVMRKRFESQSRTYREVMAVEAFRSRIDPHISDPRHRALARVGLDLWRYVGAAELLATHYSLSVRVDPETLAVEAFAVTPPLVAMFESSQKQIHRALYAIDELDIDPQLVLAINEVGMEAARSAAALGNGPMMMRSLRAMWITRVITEAFLLGLEPDT